MKPISETLPTILERIGPPATDETKPMPIGPDVGKVGSDGKPKEISDLSGRVLVAQAAYSQTKATPEQVDLLMVRSLPLSVATSFKEKINWGSDPAYIGETEDYEFHGEHKRADILDALEQIEQWIKPAGHNDIVIELGKLRALVTTRKEDQDSLAVILGAFAEQIEESRYPIDVVRQARKDSAETCRFWPSWSDFKEQCDRLFLRRKAYYNALRRYLNQAGQADG